MSDFTVIIPARYASTRLPGKALLDLGGKPMIVRVVERAQSSGASRVVVATDDPRITAAVEAIGCTACLTPSDLATGTDRVAAAADALNLSDDTLVVNVQGDEPLIAPRTIVAVARDLENHGEAAMATAAHPIEDLAAAFNPNIVKVVLDAQGYALYFSRAPVPFARDAFAGAPRSLPDGLPMLHHVGIYAYRAGFLRRFRTLALAPLERYEALEQLRALWHGYRISVAQVEPALPGVDTQHDLEQARLEFDREPN
jgi:3-deoxy-manno-octulosonate cytidylyltransferase (CMP-KDO synthetase)